MRISDWSSDVCSLGVQKDYVPIGREELVAIAPEAILIGHGHFDHAGDLGYIAGHARATVVAGRHACATARSRAAERHLATAFPSAVLRQGRGAGPGPTAALAPLTGLPTP